MNWFLLGHDILVAVTGACGLLVGQKIQHFMNTWTCPHCKAPQRISLTSPDKDLRERVGQEHIREFHPEVAEKTRP